MTNSRIALCDVHHTEKLCLKVSTERTDAGRPRLLPSVLPLSRGAARPVPGSYPAHPAEDVPAPLAWARCRRGRGSRPTRPPAPSARAAAPPSGGLQGVPPAGPIRPQGKTSPPPIRPQGKTSPPPIQPQGKNSAPPIQPQGKTSPPPIQPQGKNLPTTDTASGEKPPHHRYSLRGKTSPPPIQPQGKNLPTTDTASGKNLRTTYTASGEKPPHHRYGLREKPPHHRYGLREKPPHHRYGLREKPPHHRYGLRGKPPHHRDSDTASGKTRPPRSLPTPQPGFTGSRNPEVGPVPPRYISVPAARPLPGPCQSCGAAPLHPALSTHSFIHPQAVQGSSKKPSAGTTASP
ncbi:basic salivary proline-rich protein 2-like [Prinia subflava]|uniref:basic salivary proline-rich protein 2-like n=1 Tax=Prinia subflava TaxID=208062 RepID=UPI002FE21A00